MDKTSVLIEASFAAAASSVLLYMSVAIVVWCWNKAVATLTELVAHPSIWIHLSVVSVLDQVHIL